MSRRQFAIYGAGLLAFWASAVAPALACPFCSAVSQTFSEEIDSMDVAVIATLIEPPPPAKAGDPNNEVPRAKFEIIHVIKGEPLVSGTKVIETLYFGEDKKGEQFLVMGVDPPNLMWSTPLRLSERGRAYVQKLPELPAEGSQRLRFFQDYLEDKDEMLARDAYYEFARAPYESVKALRKEMNHDQLISWIQDENVPASRRRLYLTMLGTCGSESDLALLEGMLKSTDRKAKSGLDALIGCYLTLRGPDGLTLIEDLFLKDAKAEYADTYAAIMALRFHGTEGGVIPRERVVESLHYMLERPQLADLVIPDLARWEDWSQMDKLVELFKTSDDKTSWVRVPVINYLRACPKPEAKTHLTELEKIDPASVKRANTFFPFAPASKSEEKPKTSRREALEDDDPIAVVEPVSNPSVPTAVPTVNSEVADAGLPRSAKSSATANASPSTAPVDGGTGRLSSATLAVTPVEIDAPNRITILGVALVVGVILMLLQWTLLGGARPTSH